MTTATMADTRTPIQKVLAVARGKVPQADGSWMALCPAHDDSNPSLHITEESSGKILLHCFKKCGVPSICHAWGLTKYELFPDTDQPTKRTKGRVTTKGKQVAEYIYQSEDGTDVIKAVRYEQPGGGKSFSQFRSDGRGGWIPGVKGIEPVLYRLPELITAPMDRVVFVVEGEKKVEALRKWGLIATCNVGGAGKWRDSYSDALRGREVVILPDNDPVDAKSGACPGRDHAESVGYSLIGKAKSIKVVTIPGLPSKGDIVDFQDAGGTLEQLWELLETTPPRTDFKAPAKANSNADKPKVFCSLDELSTNNAVIGHLAKVPTVFQRGGSLVRIIQEPVVCVGIVRPANSPSIQPIPESGLRETLSNIVTFQQGGGDDDEELTSIRVPSYVTKAIHQRGEWAGVRKLESVVTYPILRADGSIASSPGYDPSTGLYLHIPAGLASVPSSPGIDDARAAVETLRDIVADFPLQAPEHVACWLAMLLTPLARFAFTGPTPLFVIDANTRGSGKTLLSDLVSHIVSGMEFAKMSPCRDDDEMRKRITAIAMRGDPLILLDNVAGDLGGPSFDAALTSTSWTDRVLGSSRQITLPLYSVWVATGNNVILAADTTRRVCHIRLSSPEERPEERTDFRHPDIIPHVKANRPALLSAALTILSAYCRAGRPRQHMRPWGSFEGWSNIVRQSLIWAGEPDPAESRDELIVNSDTGASLLADLISGWEQADPENEGLTASQVIKILEDIYCNDTLKMAVRDLCGTQPNKVPSAVALGKHMRKYRRRVIGGKSFDCVENRDGVKVWKIIRTKSAGDAGDKGDIFNP